MTAALLKPENAKNTKIYSPLYNPNRNEFFLLCRTTREIPKLIENEHVLFPKHLAFFKFEIY